MFPDPTRFDLIGAFGSPLINTGPGACLERDQRGALRIDACDIGAVEYGAPVGAPAEGTIYLPLLLK